MIRLRNFIVGLFGIVALQAFADVAGYGPQVTLSDLQQAQKDYEAGKYKEAEDIYRKASEQKGNGHDYFNLGSVFYRQGKIGEATAALLKARSLLPRDPDIKANLAYVQSNAKDRLETRLGGTWTNRIHRLLGYFSRAEWLVLHWVLLAVAGVWFFFAVRRWQPWSIVVSLALGLAIVFGFKLIDTQPTWGAVIADEAGVHSEPIEQTAEIMKLHAGAPVIIESKARDWTRIQIATPTETLYGWVKNDELESF